MNRIVAALSKLLEPEERECARGDLEEWGLSVPAAAANILGLVVRRQLAEWSLWGQWAAPFGVAVLSGYFLSELFARVETQVFLQIRTYLHYGVAYEPGGVNVEQVITYAATGAITTLLWSWACGFVLASLSRRTFLITSFLLYFIFRESFTIQSAMSGNLVLKNGLLLVMLHRLLPLDPFVLACLCALVMGACAARKGTLPQATRLCLAAVGLTLIVLLVWMESWFAAGFAHWSGQQYLPAAFLYRALPWLLGAWPMISIPLLQDRRPNPGQLTA